MTMGIPFSLNNEGGYLTEMEHSKLMTPLFYEGNFNREGRRMRAVFEREIIDGTTAYRLWRGAGKPDESYPRAENDKYLLHVEINGYLLPLGITEYRLVIRSGTNAASEKLYGGEEGREQYFDNLRKSGGDDAARAALMEEDKVIAQYGSDPVYQMEYICSLLEKRVHAYLESKENGGQTFPDFYGALVLNELARCQELSTVYKAKRQAERTARWARAEAEEKAYCAERNQEAEQAVAAAIQVIRNGGILKNKTVSFYRGRYSASSYSIVNYLMRQYHVDVPLRTQGWINEMLSTATVQDGRCTYIQFLRSKRGRGSQKFFECTNALIRAVTAQPPEQAA